MAELKPCPFCGGTKIKMYSPYSPDLHGFVHLCEINGEAMVKVDSRFFKTEEEAVEAWNRRAVNVPDTNVGDTISRQAAVDMFQNLANDDWNKDTSTTWANAFAESADMIEDLPAAQTQRMRGRWMESDTDGFVCSVCHNGYKMQPTIMGKPMFEFCPCCGAQMEGQDG